MIKKTIYIGNPAYLSTQDEQLLVEMLSSNKDEDGKIVKKIPIEDVGVLVLDSYQITISLQSIQRLVENNVAIITCGANHIPTALTLSLEGNTLQSERYSDQIGASMPLKKQLWQQTIKQKIENQAALLKIAHGSLPRNMQYWASEVKSGDPDNLEGRAAAFYWSTLFENIPDFRRERAGLPPNNLLNYGYAVLRAIIARSLVASGLLPTLGIHHHSRYNAYCLADDIMEPFRPFVDRIVLDIVSSGVVLNDLSKELKAKLLSIPVTDVMIEGKSSPLMVAAQITTSSLAKCFAGESRKISYPELALT
jgi:CRISPR-associated endonuclease Cas1